MAKNEKVDTVDLDSQVIETKKVRNRGNGKLELYIDGKVTIIMPGTTVEVPKNYVVQKGIGLFEV